MFFDHGVLDGLGVWGAYRKRLGLFKTAAGTAGSDSTHGEKIREPKKTTVFYEGSNGIKDSGG